MKGNSWKLKHGEYRTAVWVIGQDEKNITLGFIIVLVRWHVHNHKTNWKKIFPGALFEKNQTFALYDAFASYDALASYIYDALA